MSPIGEKPAATGFGVAGAPSRKSWMPAADHVAATWCQPDATVQSVTAEQVVVVAGAAWGLKVEQHWCEGRAPVHIRNPDPPRARVRWVLGAPPRARSRCGGAPR